MWARVPTGTMLRRLIATPRLMVAQGGGRWHHGVLVAAAVLALALSACSGGDTSSPPASSATPTVSANRPASPAKLSIITPKNGQVVNGTTVEMKVSLKDAKIVPADERRPSFPMRATSMSSWTIELTPMTGDTSQLLSNLTPGQHLLKVEFVASDHAPFDSRVIARGRVRGEAVNEALPRTHRARPDVTMALPVLAGIGMLLLRLRIMQTPDTIGSHSSRPSSAAIIVSSLTTPE